MIQINGEWYTDESMVDECYRSTIPCDPPEHVPDIRVPQLRPVECLPVMALQFEEVAGYDTETVRPKRTR